SMSDEFHFLFKTLARRFRKETHLSDLTFTVLEVIPTFRRDFVQFFHPLPIREDEKIEVTREFVLESGDGRPDFVFQGDAWYLIVENKLSDRNYHAPYLANQLRAGCPTCFGLITNHQVSVSLDSRWAIRSWKEFVQDFERKNYGEFNGIFAAYLCYVREV